MSLFRPLRDIATFRGGGTPSKAVTEYWDGAIPWATVKDFTSTKISATQDSISEAGLRNSSANLIPRGHVIIPTRMSLGKAAINEVDLAINQDLRALIPKEPLDAGYLLHAVLSLKDTIIRKGAGATVKGITQDELYGLEIFFPPLDDQIRIAHLLSKVQGLITQRKQQLQQLDDLLKSVFLEMFGDPIRNEKGWDKVPLCSLGSINRGVSKHRPRNAPELLGGEYPLIQTGEVSKAGTYITSHSQTYSAIGFAQSKLWPAGTLCITIAANIAQTSTLTFDACFPDSVVGFIAYEGEAHNLYVHGLFWFFQAILEKNAPAAAQKNINLEILRGLQVPKPPLELQTQFASAVDKVESLRALYQQSLSDLEDLYGALSQQAFKGELDLSRVPLPGAEPAEPQTAIPAADTSLADAPNVIDLPDTELLRAALDDRARLKELLPFWLEASRAQLNGAAFSAQAFLTAAQTRITELHPDNEFELDADAYEQVKTWVFEALASGWLKQGYADADNRVTLASQSSDWGTW